MKILFIMLALVLSAGAQADELLPESGVAESKARETVAPLNESEIRAQKNKLADEAREKEHQATKPKCTNIRFTGVAAAPLYGYVIAQVLASRDIEDTLARNPIQCRQNQFGNYECTGVAYFKNKKGTIIDWSKEFYSIDTPVDFNTGRENIELEIRRKDAVCAK